MSIIIKTFSGLFSFTRTTPIYSSWLTTYQDCILLKTIDSLHRKGQCFPEIIINTDNLTMYCWKKSSLGLINIPHVGNFSALFALTYVLTTSISQTVDFSEFFSEIKILNNTPTLFSKSYFSDLQTSSSSATKMQ